MDNVEGWTKGGEGGGYAGIWPQISGGRHPPHPQHSMSQRSEVVTQKKKLKAWRSPAEDNALKRPDHGHRGAHGESTDGQMQVFADPLRAEHHRTEMRQRPEVTHMVRAVQHGAVRQGQRFL